MFVDRAKIFIKAGDGGDGCVAFRREKFVPKGGPSGGDGGKGGDIFFRSTSHLNTLLPFRFKQHFRAERGGHGSGKNRHGKDGEDIIVEVPVGTQVVNDETGELVFDFTEAGCLKLIARGGKGGRGNATFATSTNQAPRKAQDGKAGDQLWVVLELKVLADLGLVGYPNAGKSTLISAISAARPKIADYPFTTLSPNLGVVLFDDHGSLVVADIPGLIEGAHSGSGLGDQFLRHVERCKILVHLIDVSGLGPEDPVGAIEAINKELGLYGGQLREKRQLIVASKLDSAESERLNAVEQLCSEQGLRLLKVSAVTGEGLEELKWAMRNTLEEVISESGSPGRDV
jgi:GTP-binding protein